MSCCQSLLLRAKRETSRAQTAPTLPRQTSATIRSKPARCTLPAAERPRSSSEILVDDLDLRPAEHCQAIAHGVLQGAALTVVQNLMRRGLAHVEQRLALQMVGTDLLRDHHRPPSTGPRRLGAHDPGSVAPSGRSEG